MIIEEYLEYLNSSSIIFIINLQAYQNYFKTRCMLLKAEKTAFRNKVTTFFVNGGGMAEG